MSQVRPGESIQRALDEAGAGATIELAAGTYAENVWIRHGGVTLTGTGAGRTVLVPGDSVPEGIPPLHDAAADVVSGITVHGACDVTIAGLTVRGSSGAGIYAHTVTGLTVRDVEAAGNAVWGVYVRESSRCEVTGCTASGSQYGGIALSFCPEADGLVADNEAFANAFGIFIDNSSHVRVLRNACHGNAAGLLMLNQTYEGEPDGGVRDCLVSGNDLYGNGLAAGGDAPDALGAAGPPISGVGLALIGTHRVSVVDNRIHDNHPGGETVMGAAFVMGSSKDWGGDDAVDNHILWNLVTGNSPLDHQLGVDLERQVCAGNTADKGEPEGWGR
ncbi:right-handed parallel beta-helix repeat-containing protein [Nonomuraea sp. NPDC026600]|uniref:right-handed parallel beta-helix repeat-containing protein n=1 Tax=Nonomuraea sp. NPDC026600 TaxID=3155363 RepID=UPI0033C0C3C0